jgi:NAD(P)H-hydrate epimerase
MSGTDCFASSGTREPVLRGVPVLSIAQTRELDRSVIGEGLVSGRELMRRAGRGIARKLERLCRLKGFSKKVLFLAGKGNNGGDAFAAASSLYRAGGVPRVLLTAPPESLRNEALWHFRRLETLPVRVERLSAVESLPGILEHFQGDVLVDGLLGTGFRPPLSSRLEALIQSINRSGLFTAAIDVPSGLVPGAERPEDHPSVRADMTFTVGAVKHELLEPRAVDRTGRIEWVDIGYPRERMEDPGTPFKAFHGETLRYLLPRRRRNAHKGCFGHALIVGGARGMAGAPLLAARAALRSGGGRVTVAADAACRLAANAALPEIMTASLDAPVRGAPEALGALLEKFSSLCIGPGLGTSKWAARLFEAILASRGSRPLVLDADALNLWARPETRPADRPVPPVVWTPHPGEAARLLQTSPAAVQSDRRKALGLLVERLGGVVVLKGAHTLVGDGESTTVHLSGTPALAAPGMGDVLSGILVSLLGRGWDARSAADTAVALHGLAAEDLEDRTGPFGLLAGEIADHLPVFIRSLGLLRPPAESSKGQSSCM